MLYRVSWDDILTDTHRVFYFHKNEKDKATKMYMEALRDPLCKNLNALILTCKVQFRNYKKKTYTYLCDVYGDEKPQIYEVNGELAAILSYEYKTRKELIEIAKQNNFSYEQYKILEVK